MTHQVLSVIIVVFSLGIAGQADHAHSGHCSALYQQFHKYAQTCERSCMKQYVYMLETAPSYISSAVR